MCVALMSATALATGLGLLTNNLNLGGPPATATLEVNDLSGVIRVTPYATIEDYITTSFAGGLWSGFGIHSNTALNDLILGDANEMVGILSGADYSALNVNPMFGYTVLGTEAALFKYTYFGDSDFTGWVDGTDYSLIDFAWSVNVDNTDPGDDVPNEWVWGDYDYDNSAASSIDYSLIDNAFNTQVVVLSGSGGGVNPVPEPSTIVLLVLSFLSFFVFRRFK